jgi:hypothetical protein
MDKVEQLMANRKWVKHCLRTNCAAPEDIQLTGKVKIAKIYSNLLYKREKEPELYDAIKEIAPEWWDEDTRIILNKDLVAKRHKDGNKGHSWCLWLGDFTSGGGLNFDDGTKIEGKYQWFKTDGQIHHWNDPHEGGTKYTIVLFRSDKKPKTHTLNEARKRKLEREKAERERVIAEQDREIREEFLEAVAGIMYHGVEASEGRPYVLDVAF